MPLYLLDYVQMMLMYILLQCKLLSVCGKGGTGKRRCLFVGGKKTLLKCKKCKIKCLSVNTYFWIKSQSCEIPPYILSLIEHAAI